MTGPLIEMAGVLGFLWSLPRVQGRDTKLSARLSSLDATAGCAGGAHAYF